MRTKDHTVECEFHPFLTGFLFFANAQYRIWNSEIIITSGSEDSARHSKTSLHYNKPCQAADVRSWDIRPFDSFSTITAKRQHAMLVTLAAAYCTDHDIPINWLEVILESDHIHIEYQPKRQ